jgi:hypothetical protein
VYGATKRANPTMKLSRRNVLAGIGGLAVGGGALLGSGAFSSVEAQRDVEVNVVTDNEIAADDRFADILVHVDEYETVAVDDGSANLNTDGSGLFPENDDPTTSPPGDPGLDDAADKDWSGYVSLLQNDVTLVFGFPASEHTSSDDRRLLPNANLTYSNLIALANSASQDTEGEHTLSFNNGGFSTDTEVKFDSTPTDLQVTAESVDERQVNVNTATADDSGGTLDIEITDPTS